MIEIKHKTTGEVLHRVDAETLSRVDMSGANLSRADLSRANLSDANLIDANLRSSNLFHADLSRANLRNGNLSSTDLSSADLFGVDLFGADLSRANLFGANLYNTDLTNADLSDVRLGDTHFADCPTLHLAKGLKTINHKRPSNLDARTLRACVNYLPDVFLTGVGYNQSEIDYLRSMYAPGSTGKVIQYYSCFLSYAHSNNDFTERLRTDLIKNGVNCWKDDDLQTGTRWKDEIDRAIKSHDKLVLVCSRRSVYRDQVVREILRALEEERTEGTQKFFPLYLDTHIFSDEVMGDAREKVRSGEWKENWIHHIRKYQTADFSKWPDEAAYQKALEKLLHDLKQPPTR